MIKSRKLLRYWEELVWWNLGSLNASFLFLCSSQRCFLLCLTIKTEREHFWKREKKRDWGVRVPRSTVSLGSRLSRSSGSGRYCFLQSHRSGVKSLLMSKEDHWNLSKLSEQVGRSRLEMHRSEWQESSEDQRSAESVSIGLPVGFMYSFLKLATPENEATLLFLHCVPSWGKWSEGKEMGARDGGKVNPITHYWVGFY